MSIPVLAVMMKMANLALVLINHIVSSSGHDEGCLARGDGKSGTSCDDEGCLARGDGKPGASGDDGAYLAKGDGNPGTSGDDGGCLANGDRNPGRTDHDHYASYLTLVATLLPDSSDDKELNQAMIASMESQM